MSPMLGSTTPIIYGVQLETELPSSSILDMIHGFDIY